MSSRLRTLLAAATLLATTATTATAADPEWIRQFGTTSSDKARGVAVGPDGRVHVVGVTEGRLFGAANKGRTDALVITFDGDGRQLWRRQPGTTEFDSAYGVATDADGNVYVVGYTEGGALGGANKGSSDAFVIKFDRDGRWLWRRQPGTAEYDVATSVATDADGNVYVAGTTWGALGGAHKGNFDAFVIKFDRDGRWLWKRQRGTDRDDEAFGVATDAGGNVSVVGFTFGALAGAKQGHGGDMDAFVIKFDRDGRQLWEHQPGTTGWDFAEGVATDGDGNVYVVGWTEGALGGASNGERDAFVIKFDRDGGTEWTRQPGTTEEEFARAVATDADGNVYVAGDALDIYFDLTPEASLIKLDRDGLILWSDRQASSQNFGVASDADGNAYVVGETTGSLPGNTNLGSLDAFLIKYGPNGPR